MIIYPNKPVLFSVDHELEAVEKWLPNFKRAIKGRQVLFIELSPKEINDAVVHGKLHKDLEPQVASYKRLAILAHNSGLMVLPLESAKFNQEFEELLYSRGPKTEEMTRSKLYQEYTKREKLWCEKLSGKGSKTIAVMHPAHASEISKQLGIPRGNIFGTLKHDDVELEREKRAIAVIEAKRIENERLNRKAAKARARMQKKPK